MLRQPWCGIHDTPAHPLYLQGQEDRMVRVGGMYVCFTVDAPVHFFKTPLTHNPTEAAFPAYLWTHDAPPIP